MKPQPRNDSTRRIELRSYHRRARAFKDAGLTARGTVRKRAEKLTAHQRRIYNRKKWHRHQSRVRINAAVKNCDRIKAEATMRAMNMVAAGTK